jgi:hypothetical protein
MNIAAPHWALVAFVFMGSVNIACAISLWRWKKWGFYVLVATALAGVAINLSIGVTVLRALFGLTGLAILFGVLQLGDGKDKKGWTQLE